MHNEHTFRTVFRPARNGRGVLCRLPNGKVAFPARSYWNAPPPQPYEVWFVRLCGETASVAYVRPLLRLAEAPLGQSQPARVVTSGLLSMVMFYATTLVRLRRLLRPRRAQRGRP
jgi:hypothetical protein